MKKYTSQYISYKASERENERENYLLTVEKERQFERCCVNTLKMHNIVDET